MPDSSLSQKHIEQEAGCYRLPGIYRQCNKNHGAATEDYALCCALTRCKSSDSKLHNFPRENEDNFACACLEDPELSRPRRSRRRKDVAVAGIRIVRVRCCHFNF